MIIIRNTGILEKYTMYPITLGYALITGFLPFTLRARFAHIKSLLRFYRRIVQTTATDGGSVDFASLHGCNLLEQCRSYCRAASHRPHSLTDFIKHVPHCLHSYEISGLMMGRSIFTCCNYER